MEAGSASHACSKATPVFGVAFFIRCAALHMGLQVGFNGTVQKAGVEGLDTAQHRFIDCVLLQQ